MAYAYSYPTSYGVYNYPPRLYAHEPSFPNNNDSEPVNMIPEEGVLVFLPSGSSIDPSFVHNPAARPSDEETEAYLRRQMGMPQPQPVNLSALPDSRKPTSTEMAKLAIWGSPEKRLTLGQIRDAIKERYPHMADPPGQPWTRTLRHDLSMMDIFEQVKRPTDHPGKGDYWVLNVRHGESKRKPKRSAEGGSQSELSSDWEGSESTSSVPPSATSSPQEGFYLPQFTESPRPDLLLPSYPDHEQRSLLEGSGVGHLRLGHPEATQSYHPQLAPDAVDPRMTMGGYYRADSDSMRIGPSVQPLARHEASHLGLEEGPSSSQYDAPIHRRRRTEPYEDDDDGEARGMPRLRRSTD